MMKAPDKLLVQQFVNNKVDEDTVACLVGVMKSDGSVQFHRHGTPFTVTAMNAVIQFREMSNLHGITTMGVPDPLKPTVVES